MIVFIVVILAMIGVFSLRLYKTQAAVTEDSLVAADADSMEYQSTVEAARGNILDRNGNVLVSNRASYNLVIINFVFFNAPDPNGNLLKVLNLCDELGIAYESHFPVSAERPYTYTDTDDTAWQGYFRSFLASRSYDLDISAPTRTGRPFLYSRRSFRSDSTDSPRQARAAPPPFRKAPQRQQLRRYPRRG